MKKKKKTSIAIIILDIVTQKMTILIKINS